MRLRRRELLWFVHHLGGDYATHNFVVYIRRRCGLIAGRRGRGVRRRRREDAAAMFGSMRELYSHKSHRYATRSALDRFHGAELGHCDRDLPRAAILPQQ